MRLLFISANRLKRAMPPMPLGLASIIGQIDESRHEIQLLDLMFSNDPKADTRAALSGFDPEEHRRIGLYTMLEDIELGQQYLTVGDDLYWHIDPSTWATAILTHD